MEIAIRDIDGDLLVFTARGGDVHIATERADGQRQRAIATSFTSEQADMVLIALGLIVRWAKQQESDRV